MDGDGIPDVHGFCTTYDAVEMSGAASYVAALFIGVCEAMADFARVFDTEDAQRQWSGAADAARATVESALWSDSGGYYQLDDNGPFSVTLLADALCGLRYAARDKLPGVLDMQRVASHLSRAFSLNVLGVADAQMGASNMVQPSGEPVAIAQGRAVWPGGTYFVAALMSAVGQAAGRADLVAAALTTGYGVYRTTYEDDRTAFWFDTPALWLPEFPSPFRAAGYQRCRAAWELLSAVKDPFPPGWAPARAPCPARLPPPTSSPGCGHGP